MPAAGKRPSRSRALLASVPLGRFGEPAEVANLIRLLLSDAASCNMGQVVCVDGGVTAAWTQEQRNGGNLDERCR